MEPIRLEIILDREYIEILIPSLNQFIDNLELSLETNSSLLPKDRRDITKYINQTKHLQSILSYQLKKYEEEAKDTSTSEVQGTKNSKIHNLVNRILRRA